MWLLIVLLSLKVVMLMEGEMVNFNVLEIFSLVIVINEV